MYLHTISPKHNLFRKNVLLLLAMRSLVAGSHRIVLRWGVGGTSHRSDQGIIHDRKVGLFSASSLPPNPPERVTLKLKLITDGLSDSLPTQRSSH